MKNKKQLIKLQENLNDIKNTIVVAEVKQPNDPIADEEELEAIKNFFVDNPNLKGSTSKFDWVVENGKNNQYDYEPTEPWIQTHSGIRFTPLNPNSRMININDIAQSLSNLCRFTGQVSKFYSIAQHSVLVSYICDSADALSGLLHDSSEAYIGDLSTPLKHSGYFDNFKNTENKLMKVICQHFNLPELEPPSVKAADKRLLYTEARDLLKVKRTDWVNEVEPLPFKIEALPPQEAKDLFMKRFYELTGTPETYYNHYLKYEYNDIS